MASKLLLLVEDEKLIADALECVLKDEGFDVQMASDGAEALEALEEAPETFAALVTDIRLPRVGPDGFELAHRARELSPTTAVIYMSGDAAIEWASKGVPKSIMLQKPFAMAQLVAAVSNLLNDLQSPI